MKEKELRIALVCFGGVSLAIYMHGVSKEFLKLVRASSALHAITDRSQRLNSSYGEASSRHSGEADTERVYFDLLREIGRKVDLRVVVDIVAGASAGGINGTMLARALSHDLAFDRLRELWLDNGDVNVLLAEGSRPGRFVRMAFGPLISGAAATGLLPSVTDAEVRRNLSMFVGSRWFRPPFDGRRMAGLMYDAVHSLGAGEDARSSLIPSRQKLDLYVTLTNYYGLEQLLPIHNPPLVHEREHRQVLHFHYQRAQSGTVDSDFEAANAAALAFAARATSSFPGAFPPARIAEIDDVIAARGHDWPQRQRFLERNFHAHLKANIDPAQACFIDGSVLNNRPFREAIDAIHGRPAYRQVDRRLVYIDPSPTTPASDLRQLPPGFISTLKGAISDLPRAQPMTDELTWVADFNDRVQKLRSIIDGARPAISMLVDDVFQECQDRPVGADTITRWREDINAKVVRDAGFAYQGYVRLKLASVIETVSRLICGLRGVSVRSPEARAIEAVFEAWCARNGIVYREPEAPPARAEGEEEPALARWARFLLDFDVDYRMRRINFMIEGQNRLYRLLGHVRYAGLDPVAVDRLKRELYGCLDSLRLRQDPRFFSSELGQLAAEIFDTAPEVGDLRNLQSYAERFADANRERILALVERLSCEIDLASSSRDIDVLLAQMSPEEWPLNAHSEVLVNYLGFPYWDVLTLPVTTAREAGEFREILVERISPLDATTLAAYSGPDCLKGTGFGYFAAFLSRGWRENDYLLGRLHAIDRLIDIVVDACGGDTLLAGIDVGTYKKRAFAAVLDTEAANLVNSSALVAGLKQAVARL